MTTGTPLPRGPRWSLTNLAEQLGDSAVRWRGPDSFMALCPCHSDKTASLSVTWSASVGGILLYCHGCQASAAEVADALGMAVPDLFDEPRPQADRPRVGRSPQARKTGQRRGKLGRLPARITKKIDEPDHQWQTVASYDYLDDGGQPIQRVLRRECACGGHRHKTFTQRWLNESGTWVAKKPSGFVPVLYRQAEIVDAVAAGQPVWILEGEKDVHTAEVVGVVACTNAMGAGNFPAEQAGVFDGADVRVVIDRDGGGYQRGISLHKLLVERARSLTILMPKVSAAKSDFTDHVDAGDWDPDDANGGLIAPRLDELAAHAALAAAHSKADMVSEAAAEVTAQLELASDGDLSETKRGTARSRAKRWAAEVDRLAELASEAVRVVVERALHSGTPWATTAAEAADELWLSVAQCGRQAHQSAGVAVPPLLAEPVEESTQDAEPTDAAAEGAAPPAATAGAGAVASTSASPSRGQRDSPAAFGDSGARHGRAAGLSVLTPSYRIVEGHLVEVTVDKEGVPRCKSVLSIDARIVQMEYLEATDDDDVDKPQLFGREHLAEQKSINPSAPEELSAVIIGYHHPGTGEFMQLRVGADEYRDCTWVETLPGPPQYDSRPSGVAKLRDALKGVADGQITRIVRYRSTGWRRDDQGQWFFVHAGGAIDADGARVAPVLLSGPLARFDLPAPATNAEQLRAAFVGESGVMLERLPLRVAAPLLGHVFRSAMGPNPWVLTLVGSPGSYKTSLASVAMHHWGEQWDRRHPASSMSGNGDTLNALRIKLHAAKDALYWADDVAPTRDWASAQRLLGEFARMVHNGEQRSRSTRDGQGVLDGTAPRSSALVTSEVMPTPGSSGAQRQLVIPLSANDIDLTTLIDLDRDESRFGRATVMASFLQWLAPQLDTIKPRVREQVEVFAAELRSHKRSDRESEAAANCWTGWLMMAEFLLDREAITVDEYCDLLVAAREGIEDAVEAATDPDLPTRPGARVRELLVYALRAGLAYVDDVRTGDCPEWPLAGRLGWRRISGRGLEGIEHLGRPDPRAIRLGWVNTDSDGPRQLLVDSAALEAVLKAAATTMTEAPNIDRGTALRALNDEGMLITEQRKDMPPRFTVQRTLHCENRRCRVTAILLDPLLGEDDGGAGGQLSMPDPPGGDPTPGPDAAPDSTDSGGTTLFDHTYQPPTEPGKSAPESSAAAAEHGGADAPESGCQGQVLHSGHSSERELTNPAAPVEAPMTAPAADSVPAPPSAVPARRVADPIKLSPKGNRPNPEHRQQWAGPAAIADVSGLWLPDGRHVELGDITHVGQLAELVQTHRLGTAVTKYWNEPGQIWVSAALSEQMGLTTPELTEEPDFGKRRQMVGMQTAGADAVTAALRAGWFLGGGKKDTTADRLGSWTRIWRGEQRGVWLVLMAAVDPAEVPVLVDELGDENVAAASPAAVVRRLKLFAAALDFPWKLTNQTTGIDLMKSARGKDRAIVFAPSTPVEPAKTPSLEADFSWSREPSEDERAHLYVHGFDRGGSHAAGVAGLELGIGDPTFHEDGYEFDKKLPGYWLVDPGEPGDWRYPHPLNPIAGRELDGPIWVTTPSLEIAVELGLEPEVLQAWIWHEHARILDPWYMRIGEGRMILDTGDPDATAAREMVKATYTRAIGMMGSETFMAGREGYAPERRHHIVAKARANILRRVTQIGRDSAQWPVAISNDTLVYVSSDPDPRSAWPGKPEHCGRRFGQYKWEGSALLSEHLPYLTGGRYRAKDLLDKDNWAPAALSGGE